MSAPPQIVAFHVGIVVRDLDAVIDRYTRMFGIDRWHARDATPEMPQRIAYGGRDGTGMAFELISPAPPDSIATSSKSTARASSTSASGRRTSSVRCRPPSLRAVR